MPETDQDASAQAAQVDQETAGIRSAGVAAGIPLASEPLKASPINALGKMLVATVKKLSGGELEAPPIERITGSVDRVPADIGTGVLALSQFIDQHIAVFPELEQYKFDPVALMADNEGIAELQTLVNGLGSDAELIAAIRQGAAPAAAREAPEPAEGDEAETEEGGLDG